MRKIDLGKISVSDGKVYYMCNLMGWGLGVDANITAENLRCCGPCRYDIGGIWNILKGLNRRAKVNIDGEILDDDFSCILVQNNQHGGSFLRFAPYAKIVCSSSLNLQYFRMMVVWMLYLPEMLVEDLISTCLMN